MKNNQPFILPFFSAQIFSWNFLPLTLCLMSLKLTSFGRAAPVWHWRDCTDAPMSAKGAGWSHWQPTLHYPWKVTLIGQSLWGLQDSKCQSYQEEKEDAKNYSLVNPTVTSENCFQMYWWQQSGWEWSAWVCKVVACCVTGSEILLASEWRWKLIQLPLSDKFQTASHTSLSRNLVIK